MPTITKITEQKRSPNRRNIFLDGRFAFGCNVNVVARFRLHPGMPVSAEQVREIEFGEVKQECFDAAMRFLAQRLHSRSELYRKLARREWGDAVIEHVLDELTRLGYIDDERFAKTKAQSAAQHKQHGRRRAFIDLIRLGVKGDVADKALREVYNDADTLAVARKLAQKQASRLRNLDPVVARRRLVGMLQRRGFDYEDIRPVVEETLGNTQDT
jgi:regulatory protein